MKKLELGMEAPAIRVKTLKGDDNVVGSLADGVCVIKYLNNQDELQELIDNLDKQAGSYKKLLPTIVLDKSLTYDVKSDRCKVVIDYSGAFFETYRIAFYAIDEDGIIVYKGDSLDDCMQKIEPLLKDKKKKHSHEDWMRGY